MQKAGKTKRLLAKRERSIYVKKLLFSLGYGIDLSMWYSLFTFLNPNFFFKESQLFIYTFDEVHPTNLTLAKLKDGKMKRLIAKWMANTMDE